jgi:hypothetical protein
MESEWGYDDPDNTKSLYYVALDHARTPGAFDYTQPQTYFAIFPDTEKYNYVELGGNLHKGLQISKFSS